MSRSFPNARKKVAVFQNSSSENSNPFYAVAFLHTNLVACSASAVSTKNECLIPAIEGSPCGTRVVGFARRATNGSPLVGRCTMNGGSSGVTPIL